MGKKYPDESDVKIVEPTETVELTVRDEEFIHPSPFPQVIRRGSPKMRRRLPKTTVDAFDTPNERHRQPLSTSTTTVTEDKPIIEVIREAPLQDMFLCRHIRDKRLRWVTSMSIDAVGLAQAFEFAKDIQRNTDAPTR